MTMISGQRNNLYNLKKIKLFMLSTSSYARLSEQSTEHRVGKGDMQFYTWRSNKWMSPHYFIT